MLRTIILRTLCIFARINSRTIQIYLKNVFVLNMLTENFGIFGTHKALLYFMKTHYIDTIRLYTLHFLIHCLTLPAYWYISEAFVIQIRFKVPPPTFVSRRKFREWKQNVMAFMLISGNILNNIGLNEPKLKEHVYLFPCLALLEIFRFFEYLVLVKISTICFKLTLSNALVEAHIEWFIEFFCLVW